MLLKIVLDKKVKLEYNYSMKNEIAVKMSPEGLEVANTYLQLGSVSEVCTRLKLDENTVSEYLNKREIKQYIDQVYLDTGYRNRFKLASALDNIIEEKLAEAEESQMYTNKDVADLLQMAHKMRMDEIKAIHQGGGNGSIIGRNCFQRKREDSLALLDQMIQIYRSK